MSRCGIFACCAVLLFTSGMTAPDAGAQSQDAMAAAHVAAARAATYRPWHDYSETFATMCRQPGQANTAPSGPGRSQEPWGWYAEPVKVFDNLYYLGSSYSDNQAVWAVTTSEGIILIDSGYQYSVEGLVGDGLRKVGLDPKRHRVRDHEPRSRGSLLRRQTSQGDLQRASDHVRGGLGCHGPG